MGIWVDAGPGDEDQDNPAPEQKQHQGERSSEPRRCKRCRTVLGPEAITARFGDQPRLRRLRLRRVRIHRVGHGFIGRWLRMLMP
jgi:hypothetical protein